MRLWAITGILQAAALREKGKHRCPDTQPAHSQLSLMLRIWVRDGRDHYPLLLPSQGPLNSTHLRTPALNNTAQKLCLGSMLQHQLAGLLPEHLVSCSCLTKKGERLGSTVPALFISRCSLLRFHPPSSLCHLHHRSSHHHLQRASWIPTVTLVNNGTSLRVLSS